MIGRTILVQASIFILLLFILLKKSELCECNKSIRDPEIYLKAVLLETDNPLLMDVHHMLHVLLLQWSPH